MPKRELVFSSQILNAAGSLAFAPDLRAPLGWSDFAAFITNPISLRPRAATQTPAIIEFPGGFLLHTGLPNPGFRKVVAQNRRAWEQSPVPIILNLMADRPEETREMVQALEGEDNVLAAELGFAPLLADDIILLAVEMSLGELPLIISLPAEQLLRIGPRVLDLGASALSLAIPRGTLSRRGTPISGRLFGRSLLPMTLDLVRTASRIGFPIIAAGGILSATDAHAALDAGALAVQLDACLWIPSPNKKSLVS